MTQGLNIVRIGNLFINLNHVVTISHSNQVVEIFSLAGKATFEYKSQEEAIQVLDAISEALIKMSR